MTSRRAQAVRRNLLIEYQRPWWWEFLEGIAGYIVIGVLLVGIILFWPTGTTP